ncbi:MAG: hypothetical protein IJ679_09625, partial [Lachnospiraceae bacterium]|nr:hypothetical protein [Lachnospiraceae bacterium]
RILGIRELSAQAEQLEDAGKAGDLSLIQERTPTLLSLYRAYLSRLNFLKKDAAPEAEDDRPLADFAVMHDAYSTLKEVASYMDYDAVEMVLESLKEYRLSPQDQKKIDQIERKLRALDWDAIEAFLMEE